MKVSLCRLSGFYLCMIIEKSPKKKVIKLKKYKAENRGSNEEGERCDSLIIILKIFMNFF